jgi:hypothetical protein
LLDIMDLLFTSSKQPHFATDCWPVLQADTVDSLI